MDREEWVALLDKHSGNYTRIAKEIGGTSMSIRVKLKELGLLYYAKQAAGKSGWGHKGRPPKALPAEWPPEKIADLVEEVGITQASKQIGIGAERLHKVCDSIGRSMRRKRK